MRNASAIPTRAITVPPRMARVRARSPSGARNSSTATTKVITQTTTIDAAMTDHAMVCSGVLTLKWLVSPASAKALISASSIASPTAATVPATLAMRVRRDVGREATDQPGERQGVDAGRDRELQGLQPDRGAGDIARVEYDAREVGDREPSHRDREQQQGSMPGCRTQLRNGEWRRRGARGGGHDRFSFGSAGFGSAGRSSDEPGRPSWREMCS